MSTDYPTTAGLPAQDRTARQPAIEFNDNPLAVMLDKAGRQTPDGANIVGILELALLVLPLSFNGERGRASSWVCANGEPVFVDDEGQTWMVDDDGRWEPVDVSLPLPRVTRLSPPQVEPEVVS